MSRIGVVATIIAAAFVAAAQAQAQSIEPGAEIHKNVPRSAAVALAQLVQLYGYSCNSISAVTPFAFSRGFYVYCNNWRYSYEVEDRGGNWIVTVD